MAEYSALYLAPHLDDVVLSCGGQIAQQTAAGKKVLIVTIMAGDPPKMGQASAYVEELHARWKLAETAVADRRAEDRAACRILGAGWHHARWADCIYRLHPKTQNTMYHSDADIFGKVVPAELDRLVNEIAQEMDLLPSATSVFAPLTIGNHVDHQITRLAAERFFEADRLLYYEDYPYAADVTARDAVVTDLFQIERTVSLTDTAVQQKYQAISAYQSQVSSFFSSVADMTQKIDAYHARCGGECVWRSTDTLSK